MDFKYKVFKISFKLSIILIFFQVILLRKGIKLFDIKQINGIIPSASFVGLTISNSVISFLVIEVLFGICFFPLFWPLFWILVKQYYLVVVMLLATSLFKTILIKICSKFICSPAFVKHRRFYLFIMNIKIFNFSKL